MSTRLAMPDSEIAVRYRQAKEPQKQIRILAELCNTNKAAIVDALHREGIETGRPVKSTKRGAPRRVDYDRVAALYERGQSDDEIAEQLGISWHTVRKWRENNHLYVRKRGTSL